jgi:hypothetical protein
VYDETIDKESHGRDGSDEHIHASRYGHGSRAVTKLTTQMVRIEIQRECLMYHGSRDLGDGFGDWERDSWEMRGLSHSSGAAPITVISRGVGSRTNSNGLAPQLHHMPIASRAQFLPYAGSVVIGLH